MKLALPSAHSSHGLEKRQCCNVSDGAQRSGYPLSGSNADLLERREYSFQIFKECQHPLLERFTRYGRNKGPIGALGNIVDLTSSFRTTGYHFEVRFEQIDECGKARRPQSGDRHIIHFSRFGSFYNEQFPDDFFNRRESHGVEVRHDT